MKSLMKSKPVLLALSAAVVLSACETNDDDDNGTDTAGSADIRVLHASPDAPKVNVYLNDAMSPTIEELDYAESSGFASVDEGTYNVDVYGVTASGADTASAVITADLAFDDDTRYTVVAVDTLADGDDADTDADITAKVFTDDGELSDSSMVRVQVAHLTEGAPEVYIHVTAPTDALTANTALGSVQYTSGSDLLGPTEVAAGDYRIRVSTDAAGSTVVFDSGTVTLSAGSDLFIGAIPSVTGIGDAPVQLAVLGGTGATSIFDADDGFAVRPVHAVSDVDAVDIGAVADTGTGSQLGAGDFTLYEAVDFPTVGAYTEALTAGDYDVGVDASNNDAADILLDGAALGAGMSYTVIAAGTADTNDSFDLELLAYEDDRRTIGTAAKVRIIHASTAAGDVDLYATGSAITDYSGLTPAYEDVAYKDSTGYFELAAGTYHFTAALAGTDTTGLASGAVALEAGDILTIIARDLDSDASETGDPVIKAFVIDEDAL